MSQSPKKPITNFSNILQQNELTAAQKAEAAVTGEPPVVIATKATEGEQGDDQAEDHKGGHYRSFFEKLEALKSEPKVNIGIYKSTIEIINAVADAEGVPAYLLANKILLAWKDEYRADVKASINKKTKSLNI